MDDDIEQERTLSEVRWLKSVKDGLKRKGACGSLSGALILGHSIFRVPPQLRDVNPLAYDPLVIAIGPYHRHRKLQPSITESFMCISAMKILLALQNLGFDELNIFVHRIVGDQYDIERLKMQYEGIPNYSIDAIKTIFSLDASFVTCFLVYVAHEAMKKQGWFQNKMSAFTWELRRQVASYLKIPKRLVAGILKDIFLLENQIPLCLIKAIVRSIITTEKESLSQHELGEVEEEVDRFIEMCIGKVIDYVHPFQMFGGGFKGMDMHIPSCTTHTHLLDCLYTAVTMDDDEGAKLKVPIAMGIGQLDIQGGVHMREIEAKMGLRLEMESAIHLRRAGIAFKPRPKRRGSFLSTVHSIWFDKASSTLYLPCVNISPESEAILRNLAAYEMVVLQQAEVGSYLTFMGDLIDTSRDVEVLRSSGVLVHTLRNDNEVVEMWKGMCKNLQVLYETQESMNAYMAIKDHLHNWMHYKMCWELCSEFNNRYLSAPWLTASVLAGTLLLVLTIAQTLYTMAAYYKET